MTPAASWRRPVNDARVRRGAVAAATIAAWAAAGWSWYRLYARHVHGRYLGYDLLAFWRAEKMFASGAKPYSVKAFVYPPSALILLRPIAWLSAHQLVVAGLAATMAAAWIGVMLAAAALGKHWWGLTAGVTTLLLSFTGVLRDELPLENVSVLEFLCLSLFFLLALRRHWISAGAVLGLSIALKPMLLPVLLVLLLARQWKALGAAVGVPLALNLAALGLVTGPLEVLRKLPTLLDRTGSLVPYNSAWVDVARTLGLPEVATVLLRLAIIVAALVTTWWAWHWLEDERLKLVVSSSILVMGGFVGGTLSEYHYMLTLVPLAMTVVIAGSPMRFPLTWIGAAWALEGLPAQRVLGLGPVASWSALRAIGMSCLIVTIGAWLVLRRPMTATVERAMSRWRKIPTRRAAA